MSISSTFLMTPYLLPPPRVQPVASARPAMHPRHPVETALGTGNPSRTEQEASPHGHPHRHPPAVASRTSAFRLQKLAIAGALMGVGLLLKALPAHKSKFALVSSDWKNWAKIGLGVGAMNQVNQAADLKLPPWAAALETMVFVNPLIGSLSQWRQMLLLAPLVAGSVQGATYLKQHVEQPLKDKWGIPPLVTHLAISAATVVLGVTAYGKLHEAVSRNTRFLGKQAHKPHGSTMTVSGYTACASCGGCGSVICLTEIGNFFGSMVQTTQQWLFSTASRKKAAHAH